MPFHPILCAPLPVPVWAGGIAVGAAVVFVTIAGAAYYLSMRHVLLLRLLYYGAAALAVTLAARAALSMAGSARACEGALGVLTTALTAWSEAVVTGRLPCDTVAGGSLFACATAGRLGMSPRTVHLGLHICAAMVTVLLCRTAVTRKAPPSMTTSVAALVAIALLAAGVRAAAPVAVIDASDLLHRPSAGATTVASLVAAAAGAFSRHGVGAALSELSWLNLLIRGATAVVARCAVTGALSRTTATAAAHLISSAGWLCAAVLLVRRYTRLVAQVCVRGPRTALAAAAEKSATVLVVQIFCGAALHSPLMLPVYWALDADSAHAVLWRDCTTSTSGEFLGVAAPHVLGVAAPNVLAAWGLWDERVVADVAESDAEEDSGVSSGSAACAAPCATVPLGAEKLLPPPPKRLAPAQQLRLCAGLGCPLVWVRVRWMASAATASLAFTAMLALVKAGVHAVAAAGTPDRAETPSHCFVKADPIACVALALSSGASAASAAAASRCFMPAAELIEASLIQSGASVIVDAASATFVVAAGVAVAAVRGAAWLSALLVGSDPAAPRLLDAVAPFHSHLAARLFHVPSITRGPLALHETQLLSGITPLPLLQAALLCAGLLLALFRQQSRGLVASATCSRSMTKGVDVQVVSKVGPTAASSAAENSARSADVSAENVTERPSAAAHVAAWCWLLRAASLAAIVLVVSVSVGAAVPRVSLLRWTAALRLPINLADIQIGAAAALLAAVALAELFPPRDTPGVLVRAQLRSAAGFARAAAGACLLALCVAITPYALAISNAASVQGRCSSGGGESSSGTNAEEAASTCSSVRTLTLCLVSRGAGGLSDSLRMAQAAFLAASLWGWLWQGFLTDQAGGWWPRWRRRRLARSKAGAVVSLTRQAISVGPRRKRRSQHRSQAEGEGDEAVRTAAAGADTVSSTRVPQSQRSPRMRVNSAPSAPPCSASDGDASVDQFMSANLPMSSAGVSLVPFAEASAESGRVSSTLVTAPSTADGVPNTRASPRASPVRLLPSGSTSNSLGARRAGGAGDLRLTRALLLFHRSRRCRSAGPVVCR